MKETQTQRPFRLECEKTYVEHIVPSSCVSDIWVWVSWIVLIKKLIQDGNTYWGKKMGREVTEKGDE